MCVLSRLTEGGQRLAEHGAAGARRVCVGEPDVTGGASSLHRMLGAFAIGLHVIAVGNPKHTPKRLHGAQHHPSLDAHGGRSRTKGGNWSMVES